MVVMTDELIRKYQNEINYSNADSMFNALDTIINQYGKYLIFCPLFMFKVPFWNLEHSSIVN